MFHPKSSLKQLCPIQQRSNLLRQQLKKQLVQRKSIIIGQLFGVKKRLKRQRNNHPQNQPQNHHPQIHQPRKLNKEKPTDYIYYIAAAKHP